MTTNHITNTDFVDRAAAVVSPAAAPGGTGDPAAAGDGTNVAPVPGPRTVREWFASGHDVFDVEELGSDLGHARALVDFLGWREALEASERSEAWATAIILRDGERSIFRRRVTPDTFDEQIDDLLEGLLRDGAGADRVQISRYLWGRRPAGVGAMSSDDPILPPFALLRADLDVSGGHNPPAGGGRWPSMSEAWNAVNEWLHRWGRKLDAAALAVTGGGLTVLARAPIDTPLEGWVESWKSIAEAEGWHLDAQACNGSGGLRLWGAARPSGITRLGERMAPFTPHLEGLGTGAAGGGGDEPWPEPEVAATPVRSTAEGVGERPGDRLATAVSPVDFITTLYSGWQTRGNRLRSPGSTQADTAVLEADETGRVRVYAHSESDAAQLGIEHGHAADTFTLLAAALNNDFSLAAAVARRFDNDADSFLDWASDNADDLRGAAVVIKNAEAEAARVASTEVAALADVELPDIGQYDADQLGAALLLRDSLEAEGTPVVHVDNDLFIYSPTTGVWARDDSRHVQRAALRLGERVKAEAMQKYQRLSKMSEDDHGYAEVKGEVARFGRIAECLRTAHGLRGVLELLSSAVSERDGVAVTRDSFDADNTLEVFVAANGVVNLRTGELGPFQPDLLLTQRTAVAYDPEHPTPQWDAFLRDVTLDRQELIDYLQALAGLALLGHQGPAGGYFLCGDGANGKSTWLNVIQGVLGDYAQSSPSSMLEVRASGNGEGASPFLSKLEGARLAAVSELRDHARLDDATFKSLTGGDRITTRTLHKEPRTFRPRLTLIVATNFPPRFPSDELGRSLRRRIHVVPFDLRLDDRQLDLTLEARLLRDEGPGILAWAVEGAVRYLRDGLIDPQIVVEASEKLFASMSVLEGFIGEGPTATFERDPESRVSATEVHQLFRAWAQDTEQRNLANWSAQRFYAALEAAGFARMKSNGSWHVLGLRRGAHTPKGDVY